MKLPLAIASLLLSASTVPLLASPSETSRILKAWNLRMETWNLELKASATPEQKAKVLASRPDANQTAKDLWKAIDQSLGEEWTIEASAWILRASPGLLSTNPDGTVSPTLSNEVEAIRKAIESKLIKSPKLIPVCMALVTNQDPRSLSILEKIIAENPDKKVQGVASLAAAIVLRASGDDPEIIKKRLTFLREAVIKSAEVDLGGTKVSDQAKDEIYAISYLSRGRTAPDLSGTDSSGKPMKLSDSDGKVIYLLFWSNTMMEAEKVAAITNDITRRFAGRPFSVIGVCQEDLQTQRSLEADQTVTWRSFSDASGELAKQYRVSSLPLVYILDGKRKIHYVGTPGTFAELTAEALLPEEVQTQE